MDPAALAYVALGAGLVAAVLYPVVLQQMDDQAREDAFWDALEDEEEQNERETAAPL